MYQYNELYSGEELVKLDSETPVGTKSEQISRSSSKQNRDLANRLTPTGETNPAGLEIYYDPSSGEKFIKSGPVSFIHGKVCFCKKISFLPIASEHTTMKTRDIRTNEVRTPI